VNANVLASPSSVELFSTKFKLKKFEIKFSTQIIMQLFKKVQDSFTVIGVEEGVNKTEMAHGGDCIVSWNHKFKISLLPYLVELLNVEGSSLVQNVDSSYWAGVKLCRAPAFGIIFNLKIHSISSTLLFFSTFKSTLMHKEKRRQNIISFYQPRYVMMWRL